MCTPQMPMDKDGVRAVIKAMNAKSHDLYQELSQYRTDHLPLDETVVQELDPEKSIKWNREEAKRRNRSRSSTIGAYKAKINQCDATVAQAMMDYIHDEYGFEGPVAERIYEMAYERGHSYGPEDVLYDIDEYAEFTQFIIDNSH